MIAIVALVEGLGAEKECFQQVMQSSNDETVTTDPFTLF